MQEIKNRSLSGNRDVFIYPLAQDFLLEEFTNHDLEVVYC